jgi:hypothetical protein
MNGGRSPAAWIRLVSAFVFASIALPSFVFSATIQVPAQAPTIQAGIDSAADGDTVLVAPGTYYENILIDRNVVVRSAGGPTMTTIDGSQAPDSTVASVVRFYRWYDLLSGASIEGFSIRGGAGTYKWGSEVFGGGIFVDNHFTNIGAGQGPLIYDNWVHDNVLLYTGRNCVGAGVGVLGTARVISNRIFSNRIEGDGQVYSTGAALYRSGFAAQDPLTLQDSEIFDNRAFPLPPYPGSLFGPTVYLGGARMSGNIIACNLGGDDFASTLVCVEDCEVVSNTIAGNFGIGDAPVILLGACDSDIQFRANNVTHNVGVGVECLDCTGNPTYELSCNNIAENGPGGQITGLCADAIGQNGNISVDPLYGRSGCPHTIGGWCLSENSPLLLDPPPGCGLIGALGLCPPIGIHDVRPQSPPRLQVRAPRPNPFLERTTIPFYLPRGGEVSVGIYDVMGRRVRVLEPGWHTAGDHALEWDGRDDAGRRVPSGAYVARIRAGGEELTRTLLLIR